MITTDIMFWTLAALATFIVGAAKGGLPGVGVLAVPILSQVISPGAAAGMLLPLYIVSDIYGLWLYRKSYDLWNIKITVAASLIGIGVGWATASYNNDNLVKLIVGVIGIWYSIDIFLRSRKKVEQPARPADIPRGIFWGSIAGFTSFVAHAGGIPFQMYVLPQKLDKMTYAGTLTIAFTIINVLKLPPYWMIGQINVVSLEKCIYLAPISLFGAWAGYRLTKVLAQDTFFKAVEIALLLVSLKLIYDALI